MTIVLQHLQYIFFTVHADISAVFNANNSEGITAAVAASSGTSINERSKLTAKYRPDKQAYLTL